MAQSKLWSPPRKKPLHDFTPVYTAKHTTLVIDGNLKPPVKMSSNLPNLRRLFVEARSDAEESAYSRNAFYNLVLFMSSVALFSLAAQKMHNQK